MRKTPLGRVRALLVVAAAGCAGVSGSAPPGGAPAAPSGPAEAAVLFMAGMIHHHAQAVVMAGWAPTHGAGDGLRVLCQRILISQRDEIALMQTWLRDNGLVAPEPNPRGMPMVMDGVAHEMPMPGMLSDEQMRELDQARGGEFDRLFFTYMIQHHQGAITMVEEVFAAYGGTQDERVYRFASDVYADQLAEIDRMEQMLAGMSGTGSP